MGLLGSKSPFFLLIPILSFYFDKAAVGTFDLMLVTVTLLVPFISFQLGEAAYRFLKQEDVNKNKLITTCLSVIGINLVIFNFVTLLVSHLFEGQVFKWLILVLASTVITHNLMLLYRGLNLITSYAIMGVFTGVSTLGLVLFAVTINATLDNVVNYFAIGNLIAILISIVQSSILKNFRIKEFNKSLLKRLLRFSAPLVPNAVSWWLIDLGNRYVILYFLGNEANGTFAVAARYIIILAFLNNFFLIMWQDKYLQKNIDRNVLQPLLNNFIKAQISVLLLITACSYLIILYGAGAEFNDSYKYVGPIAMAIFVSSLSAFTGVEFLKTMKTKFIFKSTIMGGIVNIAISSILINFIGLYGVLIGTLIGFTTVLIARLIKSQELKYMFINQIKTLTIFLLMFIVIYSLQFTENNIASVLTITITLLGVVLWNRNNIYKILK